MIAHADDRPDGAPQRASRRRRILSHAAMNPAVNTRRPPGRSADPRRLRLPRGRAGQRDHAARGCRTGTGCSRLCPHTSIDASELDVGLPDGPDGQFRGRASQHRRGTRRLPGLHAHRPCDRDRRVRAQSSAAEAVAAAKAARRGASTCWGSLSPGGVHSHERQIAAMVALAAAGGAPRVYVHAFLDGRDTPPKSAAAVARVPGRRLRTASPARASRRSAAATTRWTATSAGSGRGRLRSSRRRPRRPFGARRRRPRSRRPTRAAKPTSSCKPTAIARRGGPRRDDGATATSSCS